MQLLIDLDYQISHDLQFKVKMSPLATASLDIWFKVKLETKNCEQLAEKMFLKMNFIIDKIRFIK